MTQLQTNRVSELESYKRALDAAGVDYDTTVTYSVEIEQQATEAPQKRVTDLPSEGTKARQVVDAVAKHPKEWVRQRDVADALPEGYTPSDVATSYDVFKVRNGGRGKVAEYKLKDRFRRELTGQSIDVEALTEVRNA